MFPQLRVLDLHDNAMCPGPKEGKAKGLPGSWTRMAPPKAFKRLQRLVLTPGNPCICQLPQPGGCEDQEEKSLLGFQLLQGGECRGWGACQLQWRVACCFTERAIAQRLALQSRRALGGGARAHTAGCPCCRQVDCVSILAEYPAGFVLLQALATLLWMKHWASSAAPTHGPVPRVSRRAQLSSYHLTRG